MKLVLEFEEIQIFEPNELEDSWVAETGLFDPDGYAGRIMQEEVTEWAYLDGENE